MFQELEKQNYTNVKGIFAGIDYSISLRSLLTGNNPGHIFVDNLTHPRTVFALTVDGYFLAGEYNDPLIRSELSQFLQGQIFTGKIFTGTDFWMMLAIHPAEWETYLPEIIPTHEAEKVHRYHYTCDHVAFDGRAALPEGFQAYPLVDILSGAVKAEIPEDLEGEVTISAMWGSVEKYLRQGMGIAIVHDRQVVTICRAVCATKDVLEIGIDTLPAFRHRGLAAAATVAAVEQALAHGYREVSWQCDYDNIGSWKTAKKAGFTRVHEYDFFDYIFDVGDQLAQLAYRAYMNNDYKRCIEYYQKAFPLQQEKQPSDYFFIAAAYANQSDKANTLRYLQEAARIGWHSVERTMKTPVFSFLFGTKEWEDVISKIRGNA
ncbi:MAG TPA: GNAT family N-acetyltransferase [Longilinea sp.]|nr:GNAT family N-acetyltransferase [Longilinea sp.]